MKPLEIVALVIIAIGFGVVLAARTIVKKYNLAEKQSCDYSVEMSEEEVNDYKFNKASVRIKMYGLLISVPGIVLLLLFK